MATDIYGRTVTFGEPISADNVRLEMPALNTAAGLADTVGLLVQSVNMGYNQNSSQLYDLTSTDVVNVIGRPQGTIQMSRALGRRSVTKAFFDVYGNACKIDAQTTLQLTFKADGCATAAPAAGKAINEVVSYIAHYPLITGVNISTQAQQPVVTESLNLVMPLLTRK